MHWMNINLSVGDHKECISIKPKSNHCLALVPNRLTDMFVILDPGPEITEFTQPLLANVELKSWICKGFHKVDKCICQTCYMYFSPFAKQNQA